MGNQKIRASVLIIFSTFLLVGMARKVSIDLSQDAKYSWVIGKQYKTNVELVIYKNKGSQVINLAEYGGRVPQKDEIEDKFPYRYKPYRNTILGILPVGSIFKVTDVKQEGSRTLTFTLYYANIISSENTEFVGKEVNPTFLTNMSSPPIFKDEFVEDVTPGSEGK